MATILDQIVADKKKEIAQAKARISEAALERQVLKTIFASFCFRKALQGSNFVSVIAEIKRRSPAAGAIRIDADPINIARTYAEAGAACISVLTDGPHFGGSLDDLRAVRSAVSTPLLRKDFILERYQLLEAKVAGADAVLLIAEILDDTALRKLLQETHDLGLDALVECYETANLQRIVNADAKLIGINNRDLHTFSVRLEHTLELAPQVPSDCTLVSESGIRTRDDVERLAQVGVKAVLVGEILMRSSDVKTTFAELTTVSRRP
jgi:indole-3-glycerol phosphate synthase